jgi:hypothetical protein
MGFIKITYFGDHIIDPVKLSALFYGQNIFCTLYDAEFRTVTVRVRTDGAEFIFTHVMAFAALLNGIHPCLYGMS